MASPEEEIHHCRVLDTLLHVHGTLRVSDSNSETVLTGYSHVFFLPFYFQAVKGLDAEQSGIRTVPYVLSNTIGSIIVAGLTTVVGYYTPFIYLGTARK
jgi:hypothetical protein